MRMRVKTPIHLHPIPNWPVVALFVLLSGFVAPGYCLDRPYSKAIPTTWVPTANLNTLRAGHTATLLPSGKLPVVGGSGNNVAFASAEFYDPIAGTWSLAGDMSKPRSGHTATLFGNLIGAREGHSATLLPNGQILVAGGYDSNFRLDVNGAELYDADHALWNATASLNIARSRHTATLLLGGRVLIAGGGVVGGTATNSAELYLQPSNNSFRMTAIFSDQAGINQYLQLQELSGLDNQDRFSGLTLEVRSRHGVVKSITFPNDLPSHSTAGRYVLISTPHVLLPEVDFTFPPGFLPTDGGTLIFAGVDVWDYDFLPANGYTVFVRGGGFTNNPPWMATYIFRPFTGFPTGLLVPTDPVIEFYNAALDHYFISMSQPDIDALDSGRISGWKRTGEFFDAWLAKFDPFDLVNSPPPNIGPVCRLYLPPADGDSHFFSASVNECSDSRSMHPDYVLETSVAFYASLPNMQTGECLYDQTPVYRLWNARIDSNHRYTASTATRDLMLRRGYVAEGYGPNAVAMCVGGGIPGFGG